MRRGYSLVELMVTSGVSLLILGVLYALLVIGMRIYRHGSARSELQVAATLSLGRITADVDRTTPAGLSVRPDGLALVPLKGVSADGRQLWEEEVIVCHWDPQESRLLRRRCPPVPEGLSLALDPTRALVFTADELQALFLAGGPEPAIIARDVTHFEAARAETPRLLHLKIGLTREGLKFSVERDVFLRNP